MKRFFAQTSHIVLGLATSVILLFAGIHIGATQQMSPFSFASEAPTTPDYIDADMSEFWETWRLIDEVYPFEQPTDAEKVRFATRGLVESLSDPYSVFFPPVEAEQFHEEIDGQFGGIGIEIETINDDLTIISPLRDTPADQAGLEPGDVITHIDGESAYGIHVEQAASMIRGLQGTTVRLTIWRSGEVFDVDVERATISIPTVATRKIGSAYVIELFSFSENASEAMIAALDSFAESGASKLVIDLRGNPGGLLSQAIDITSMFLPEGKVVVREYEGEDVPETEHRTRRVARRLNEAVPVVVLIDGGSASASEIFAGALSEHERATLVGTPSFGKGSVQQLFDVGIDHAALKITISEWLTPTGLSITEHGLDPDINVGDILKELYGEDVDRTEVDYSVFLEEDPTLDYAIQLLQGTYKIDAN